MGLPYFNQPSKMRAGYSAEGLRAGERAITAASALTMPLWLAHAPDDQFVDYEGSVALLAMLLWWVGSGFVLAPAGGVVLVDQELRDEEPGWSEALGRAVVAVLNQAGSLVVIFTIYLALVTLIVLPGLVGCYAVFKASGDNRLLAAVFLAGEVGIGLTFLIATLGLAIPICLLEEAGPGESLGRSWQLSTLGLGSMAGLAGVYVSASLLFTIALEAIGLGWLFEVCASFVFSLFLPALLVAAYQGLAAEDAEVLGRR